MVRAERLSLLQTTFPPIHWAVMCLLGGSIVLCFLLETDDKVQLVSSTALTTQVE